MKQTQENSKIEEMSTGELSRLALGSVYQVEYTRECEQQTINTTGDVTTTKKWSLFLVEHKETK